VRRRLVVLLFVTIPLLLPAPPIRGQEPAPTVRLRLLTQSPFASTRHPFRLSVEATNTGEKPIAGLGMTLTVYYPARSRSEYRQGLAEEGPQVAELIVSPVRVGGTLQPGQRRTIVVQRRLGELADLDESALYPVKVQLESEGIPVGFLRSALVFIHERPLVPLNVSFTFVLDEGVPFLPDGTFRDDRLERTLGPGGRLRTAVEAIEAAPTRMTVAISPMLLQGLDRMSRGYRVAAPGGRRREVGPRDRGAERAAAMLQRLRGVAARPGTEVVALPLASPPVSALVSARLVGDLDQQIVRGRNAVESFLPGVSITASSPFRPPGSLLTPRSLRALVRLGVEGLLLDADTIEPAPEQPLTPQGTVAIPIGRRRSVPATAPDDGIMRLLLNRRGDPRLQAQRILGELAAIYFEQPGVDRGVAIVLPEHAAPLGALLTRLLEHVGRASPDAAPKAGWLRPVTASRLLSGSDPPRRRLVEHPNEPTFSPGFVVQVRRTKSALATIATISEETAVLSRRLTTQMLLSESRQFVERERDGTAFLGAVQARVAEEIGKVQPPASNSAITLTSRQGVIPVTLSSSAEYDVHLRVTLFSPRLLFLEGASRDVVLNRPRQALTFPVLAQTTGRFPVRVLIETPDGHRIAESRIVVRSTAYNTRALLVTVASALFLLFLWWRRVQSART
jgi:hypothetical protein